MKTILFFSYENRGGVFIDPTCPNQIINHAVSLVGYGTTNSTGTPVNYWIVRNSWGSRWAYGGYFYLQRDVNMCNIASSPAYPNAS